MGDVGGLHEFFELFEQKNLAFRVAGLAPALECVCVVEYLLVAAPRLVERAAR
jgi:hypothetical protein